MRKAGPSPSGQSNNGKAVVRTRHYIVTMIHLFGKDEEGNLPRHFLFQLLKTGNPIMGQDIGYQSYFRFRVFGYSTHLHPSNFKVIVTIPLKPSGQAAQKHADARRLKSGGVRRTLMYVATTKGEDNAADICFSTAFIYFTPVTT
jgi:hypothetical protein